MQRLLKSSHLILSAVLLLTACNLPFGSTAPSAAEAAKTSAAQTVEVLRTQAASSGAGSVTLPPINTQTQKTLAAPPAVPGTAVPASTLTPPNTLVPTKAPSATQISTATFVPIPCDRADFIEDVTVQDNSVIAPGTAFTKTWRLKNSGSCTWTTNYRLVYASGEQMGGAASTALIGNVNPGQTIDLSVAMTAPATTGTHQGFWRLQNASGGAFGWSINGDQAFWVLISTGSASTGTVVAPPSGFAVTGVTISVNPTEKTVPVVTCNAGVPFTFTANITSSAAGTVTYEWRKADGTTVVESGSKEFSSAGTQSITNNYTVITAVTNDKLTLYINNPNHQLFTSGGTFTLICSP
ncbi:MAG: NBR1-Ig-like domain-containing protein [Leptolinea sp.]